MVVTIIIVLALIVGGATIFRPQISDIINKLTKSTQEREAETEIQQAKDAKGAFENISDFFFGTNQKEMQEMKVANKTKAVEIRLQARQDNFVDPQKFFFANDIDPNVTQGIFNNKANVRFGGQKPQKVMIMPGRRRFSKPPVNSVKSDIEKIEDKEAIITGSTLTSRKVFGRR